MPQFAPFLAELASRDPYRGQIVHSHPLPAREAEYGGFSSPLPAPVSAARQAAGIERLYSHQAEAIEPLRAGRSVVIVTSTASGKTLCYNLPIVERLLAEPKATACYLFPTKALAQDQLRNLRQFPGSHPDLSSAITCGAYDGDAPGAARRRLRDSAHLLLALQEKSRPRPAALGRAAPATGRGAGDRALGGRLRHGPVDARAHPPAHRDPLRGELPSLSCLAAPPARLQLAQADGARQRAGRESRHPLAQGRLAPHKKGARRRGATLLFWDEAGFSQRPPVRSTWAKRGETPVAAGEAVPQLCARAEPGRVPVGEPFLGRERALHPGYPPGTGPGGAAPDCRRGALSGSAAELPQTLSTLSEVVTLMQEDQ